MCKWIPAKIKPPMELIEESVSKFPYEVDGKEYLPVVIRDYLSRDYLLQDNEGGFSIGHCEYREVFDVLSLFGKGTLIAEEWFWMFDDGSATDDYDTIVAYMELPKKYKEEN